MRNLLLVAFLFLNFILLAQPGTLDATFNSSDNGYGNGDGVDFQVEASVIQSDGKIIIVGSFGKYNDNFSVRIARINSNGTYDNTFSCPTGANAPIYDLALQSDGKVIIVGDFTTFNGTARNRIARLNTDGSLDATFNPGTGANDIITSVKLQSNGKIIIGGSFSSYNGTSRGKIARVNADGTLDATFTTGTGFDFYVKTIGIQTDGNIVVGGGFTNYNGTGASRIIRLTSVGTVDATFTPGTGASYDVNTLAIQPDGKILLGGTFTTYNGTARNGFCRINANGTLDVTFTVGSGVGGLSKIVLESTGKVFLVGSFTTYNLVARKYCARVNSSGGLDTTFDPGVSADNPILCASIQSDGKYVIGGVFTEFTGYTRNRITRIGSTGTLDLTFNPNNSANAAIKTVKVQSDGKILIGGEFTSYFETKANRIARLTSTGAIDATFSTGTGFNMFGKINAIAIQADGKILAGGFFYDYNGTSVNCIVRLNANGTVDGTFVTGSGFNSEVKSIAIQSDGKIVIGGEFSSYNGTPANKIIRLNSNGSIDAGFVYGTGFTYSVYTLAIQTDGKILVGGDFYTYNGVNKNNIIRLNIDGTVDASFTGNGTNGSVSDIAIQTDGKIVLVGYFSTCSSTSSSRIARINSNGSIDPTFALGTGLNNLAETVTIQSDGRILVGGWFTSYNGTAVNRLARINSNGTLDASFNASGVGLSGVPSDLELQSDNKLLVAGYFTAYNALGRNRIARLNNCLLKTSSLSITRCNPYTLNGQTYTATGVYTQNLTSTAGCDSILTLNFTRKFNSTATVSATACGSYLWPVNGVTYTSSGAKVATIPNSQGCDSVITLNLTIKQNTSNFISLIGCGSITVNGITYTTDGNYIQHLTNSQGCDSALNINVNLYAPVFLNVNSVTDVTCFGSSNGAVNVSTTGGTTPFSYSWYGSEDEAVAHTEDISGFPGDNYMLIVEDLKGCKDTVMVSVHEPNKLETSSIVTNVSCNAGTNGAINLTVTGGTAPYHYDWGGGITTEDRAGLVAGTYSVTVTDAHSCITVASITVTQPPVLVASRTTTPVLCFGESTGAINVMVSGGTIPYQFVWNDLVTTEDRTNIPAGNYSVTVTDANGCHVTLSATISQPASGITSSIVKTNVSCYNGSNGTIDLTVSGGTLPYNFNWGGGITNEDRTGLVAGNYSVTITDGNGCLVTNNATINQPAELLPSTSLTNVNCNGGTTGAINLSVTGGTMPYSYNWENGATTEDRSNLTAGNYSVTITDNNSCVVTIAAMVTEPPVINLISSGVTPVLCAGGSNGTASINPPSGGTGALIIDWLPGAPVGDGTTTISNLTANNYTCIVTDINGCSVSLTFTISQPSPIVASILSQTDVSCFGGNDGTATVNSSGGTGTHTFVWSPSGETTSTAIALSQGMNTLTITDVNSCNQSISVTIDEPNEITHSFTHTSCDSYTWNSQTYTSSGNYVQVLTASNGCDSIVTMNLTIHHSTSSSITVVECDSYTLNTQTYTTSGTYIQNLINAAGCDSTLTLNLTINSATSSSISVVECDSYTLNGQTYTTSGVYMQSFTNVSGCDSTLTLNLTIKNSTTSSVNISECVSYTLNGQTYTSSGIHVQNLTNAAGCDSTLTLNLTIHQPTSSSLTVTACDSFTLNGQTYTTSDIYTQNLTNSVGCDSILTLNLTIHQTLSASATGAADNSITATGGTSFQWIDCSTNQEINGATSATFSPLVNGSYAAIVSNGNSCDDTTNCVEINTIGIKEMTNIYFELYPNPTMDIVHLLFEDSSGQLIIRDAQGKLLQSKEILSGEQVSLKSFETGVYFFELTTWKGTVIKKVVKD